MTKLKNEYGFWTNSQTGKQSQIIPGKGASIPFFKLYRNSGDDVSFHTHPFLRSEGGLQPQFSNDDIALARETESLSIILSHEGLYFYDAR